MVRIGLLSDTHGFLDDQLFDFFSQTDEIWHAGDIGDLSVIERLQKFKPLIAVYGNIDGTPVRQLLPEHQRKSREGMDIWMTHIGGYPGRYSNHVKPEIFRNPPGLFISGHSHILKVIPDKKLSLLHINPGAAGRIGTHTVRTAVRFGIEGGNIKDIDIIELGQRFSY
ncbi:MAG TPA: metallophosphoesterase [Bacteroidaceae bacterium]|nr:metallophosphoesterase [Bacteroidaceae bacterium]